jgi:hypothetical protein
MAARRFQFSLSHLAIAVLASALTFAYLRNYVLFTFLLAVSAVVGGVAFGVRLLIEGVDNLRCPNCGAWGLARIAISSFSFRYYRCTECHTKCKKSIFGTWHDASGRHDAPVYAAKPQVDPWGNAPLSEIDPHAPGTHGTLLRHKRERHLHDDEDRG